MICLECCGCMMVPYRIVSISDGMRNTPNRIAFGTMSTKDALLEIYSCRLQHVIIILYFLASCITRMRSKLHRMPWAVKCWTLREGSGIR